MDAFNQTYKYVDKSEWERAEIEPKAFLPHACVCVFMKGEKMACGGWAIYYLFHTSKTHFLSFKHPLFLLFWRGVALGCDLKAHINRATVC